MQGMLSVDLQGRALVRIFPSSRHFSPWFEKGFWVKIVLLILVEAFRAVILHLVVVDMEDDLNY